MSDPERLLEYVLGVQTDLQSPIGLPEQFTKQRRLRIARLHEQDEGINQHKIFVLVGPPSVGKSTWVESTFEETPYAISRDEIVERVASELGWSYDDMFVTPPTDAQKGEADKKYGIVIAAPKWMFWASSAFSKVLAANAEVQSRFKQRVSEAAGYNRDIVVDMTNMTPGARKRALKAVENGDFEKIAVVFEFKGAEDVIQKVAQKRAEAAKRMGKSKTISSGAFEQMFKAFVRPNKSEGFDQIVSVDNRELLKHLANELPEEIIMNDFSKKRLQELAGIAEYSSEKKTQTLQESIKMFGMVSPVPLAGLFLRKQKNKAQAPVVEADLSDWGSTEDVQKTRPREEKLIGQVKQLVDELETIGDYDNLDKASNLLQSMLTTYKRK